MMKIRAASVALGLMAFFLAAGCEVPGQNTGNTSNPSTVTGDKTKPVITLLGDAIVTVAVNGSYTDQGATAADDTDGNITSSIKKAGSFVNTSTEGTFTITYDVTDKAGNAADQKVRTVKVVKDAVVVPSSISLLSSKNGDVVKSLLNMWDTKTSFAEETDPVQGKVLKVYTDSASTQKADWGTVLAFSNVEADFLSNYGVLKFKIKSDKFTEINVKIPGVENKYQLSGGEDLGNGWRQIYAPMIDFLSAGENGFAIFAYKAQGAGSFYITDVEFSGEPIAKDPLPAGKGLVYPTGPDQTIYFKDISPWGAGSTLAEVNDPTLGTAMESKGGTKYGVDQVIAFMGIGKLQKGIYFKDYSQISFSIKAENATQVEIYVRGNKRKLDIASGTSLGGGWYRLTAPFTNFFGEPLVDDGQIAFIVANAFRVTNIELSGDPWNVPALPAAGGLLFAPGKTTAITYGDISPWGAGSKLEEVSGTAQGTVLQSSGGAIWGPTQCMAFMGIGQVSQEGNFTQAYKSVSFKIKADGVNQLKFYAAGLEKIISFSTGTPLGSGWYDMNIKFSDLPGSANNNGQIAFLADTAFQITDVALAP